MEIPEGIPVGHSRDCDKYRRKLTARLEGGATTTWVATGEQCSCGAEQWAREDGAKWAEHFAMKLKLGYGDSRAADDLRRLAEQLRGEQ